MTARNTLLSTALAAALISTSMLAATPAFAQDAPPDTTETDASVPKGRLVDAYADKLFAGDEIAAGNAVTALRTGDDLTVTTTRQTVDANGNPVVDANGNPVMETVETNFVNPNGPMGWGEVDHSLGIAQALVDGGKAASFSEALMGTATTTTNPDGTTTTTYSGGILQMRADGMGWGQIAKELGFKSLGEIKSGRYADAEEGTTASVASDKSAKGKDTAKTARETHGKSAEHKPDHAAKADRVTGKPEKVERVAKVERPAKIDRPERPSKPERGRP